MAVLFDFRGYRIPNFLILIGIFFDFVVSYYVKGLKGIGESVLGMLIPFLILFLLFALRMLGAGDIKLFTVIGGFVGFSIWKIMLFSFIVGGILSTIHMLYHHNLVNRLQFFLNYFLSCIRSGHIISYDDAIGDVRVAGIKDESTVIHFSLAIFLGYGIWLIERWLIM